MLKTLRITLSLSMTCKINAVLYWLKSIPLLGRLLPDNVYRVRGLKIFATVVAFLWELSAAMLGKLIYFGILLFVPTLFYEPVDSAAAMLHIFVLLAILGAHLNTNLISDSDNAYCAIRLLGMDARSYALVNYAYSLAKILLGYLIFGGIFGMLAGIPFWICLLMPLYTMGVKTAYSLYSLKKFQKKGEIYSEHGPGKYIWVLFILVLAAAYILPILEIVLPVWASVSLIALGILSGLCSVRPLLRYPDYRPVHQYLRRHTQEVLEEAGTELKQQSLGAISASAEGASSRRGFAYLNDLFIKRHKKILHKPAILSAAGLAAVLLGCSAVLYFIPEFRQELELNILKLLPCFAFVLYALNRGTSYTQALFMNCDRSMLTYSFYKQPKQILALFRIRLKAIIGINLLPGMVAALGLPLLMYCAGGTDDPLNYLVVFVSILSMNIFFSVHYLTLYYLLQPYTAGSELKNFAYSFAAGLTYFVCYILTDVDVPPVAFGTLCILFCVAYCLIACVLVYFLAPKTFRIRT